MSAVTNISEASTTAATNTAVAAVGIQGSDLISTADDAFRATWAVLAKFYDDFGGVNTVGGTGDAITITTSATFTALATGMRMTFIAGAANSGAATLNLDAIGAKAVRKISGATDVALAANDILQAQRCDIIYSATANAAAGGWILINPAVSTALASYQPLDADLTAIAALAGTNTIYYRSASNTWTAVTIGANMYFTGGTLKAYEVWGGAISDESTAITTGAGKLSFSIPYAFTVVGVYATLNTVSSSGTPTFDINEAGTTIISTKIVIDVSEFTGGSAGYQGTAAGAAVISDTTLAAFAQITVDIDVAGTGAKGAKVFIIGYPT